jgi:hypothetical protein
VNNRQKLKFLEINPKEEEQKKKKKNGKAGRVTQKGKVRFKDATFFSFRCRTILKKTGSRKSNTEGQSSF